MNYLLVAILLALTSAQSSGITAIQSGIAAVSTQTPKPAKASKVKIRSSIQCGKCIERINAELPKLKGVKSVKYDLSKKLVIVSYQAAEVSADQIRTALTRIGYDADGMAADPQAYQNLPVCCQKAGH